MRKAASLLVALLAALSFLACTTGAQDDSPVRIYVFGPSMMATGSNATFNVSVEGGPAEGGGNYTISAYLEGANLTGASPLRTSPLELSAADGKFSFEVNATTIPQKLTLFINASSIRNETRERGEQRHSIEVVEPVKLSAKVKNSGALRLEQVRVNFFVDGKQVGNSTIDVLEPGATKNVTYSWLTGEVAAGQHQVKITVDMNGDGIIDEGQGDLVIYQYFYKEGGAVHPAIIFTISTVTVLAVLFLIRAVMRKRRGW